MRKEAQMARLDNQLWEIYQQSYFQSMSRYRPWKSVSQGKAGAVISTWNPYGKLYTHQVNFRLTRALMGYLSREKMLFELVWGGDKNLQYRELSVFVPCNLKTAQRISKYAKQLAFYYVSPRGRVTLCSTLETKPIAFVTEDVTTRWKKTRLPIDNRALCSD